MRPAAGTAEMPRGMYISHSRPPFQPEALHCDVLLGARDLIPVVIFLLQFSLPAHLVLRLLARQHFSQEVKDSLIRKRSSCLWWRLSSFITVTVLTPVCSPDSVLGWEASGLISTLLSCGSARECTFLPTSVPLAKPNGSMKRLVQSCKITVLQVRSDRIFSEEFMSSNFEAVIAFARK